MQTNLRKILVLIMFLVNLNCYGSTEELKALVERNCDIKSYKAEIGTIFIGSCLNAKLTSEVTVFLNSKKIFFAEMKLDHGLPEKIEDVLLISGQIKPTSTFGKCNKKYVIIDTNPATAQVVEFGVPNLCLNIRSSNLFSTSIDKESSFNPKQIANGYSISPSGKVDIDYFMGKLYYLDKENTTYEKENIYLERKELYSDALREYIVYHDFFGSREQFYKKYQFYEKVTKINLNDAEVKSKDYKKILYKNDKYCIEKLAYNSLAGKVQSLRCERNEIVVNNTKVMQADNVDDLNSPHYLNKEASVLYGFASHRQAHINTKIQYCGNELFFLDTAHSKPQIKTVVFNDNCYFIKATEHRGQETIVTLNTGEVIKYKQGKIELPKTLAQNINVQSGAEHIPYYIGAKTLYNNANTQMRLVQSYRNNKLFLNNQKILQAPLLKIFEHNHEKTIFVGGLYQYISDPLHPLSCLKELFVLDITQYPKTIFYTGKNNKRKEKCLHMEMELELLKNKANINTSESGDFIYSNDVLKPKYFFTPLVKRITGKHLTIEKKQLPYILPFEEVKSYMVYHFPEDMKRTFSKNAYDKGKEESNAYEKVEAFIDQTKVTKTSRIRYTDIYPYRHLNLYYEDEAYLGSSSYSYGMEDSFHYFHSNISDYAWYYDNRRLLIGNHYYDFKIMGMDKDLFLFTGEANLDKEFPMRENREFKYFVLVDKIDGKHKLFKFGLQNVINSLTNYNAKNGVFKGTFKDGSEIEYSKGKLVVLKNPNKNLIVEEHTLPYKINQMEQFKTPLGTLATINSIDQHDVLLEGKKVLSGNLIRLFSNSPNNTIFIGGNEFYYSVFRPYEECSKQLFLIDVSQKLPKLIKFGNDKICNVIDSVKYINNKVEINLKNNIKLFYQDQKLQFATEIKDYQFDPNDLLAFNMFLGKVTTEEDYKNLLQTKYPIHIKEEKIPLLYE
uniref:hypothetical protein n=1 Tax=Pigmentibacter ruber TaxID=2683196 RepID=UPI00131DB932